MTIDDAQELFCVFGIAGGGLKQSLRIAPNRRQRGAQFVRDVSDKVGANRFQTLELRDIVKDQDLSRYIL